MYLSEEIARKILNLNPNPERDIIDKDIAERQFQVILNGFNHLIQPGNNFLYLADEVGLGKTYIAIGIASLLRYFSDHPERYQDVIIVPKQNLQYKWQKEINNFIQKNYLLKDNIVKSVLNRPAANLSRESIKHQLTCFSNDYPNYIIYRNSSFSISSDNDEEILKWMEKLKENLPDSQKEIFSNVCSKFQRDQIIVKRAYAYLLNHSLPDVDFLIVDEAHNFRHGIEDGVSIRNQIVSRLFGATCDDEKLFDEFPELKVNIRPKVKKLIFLSATPINTQLYEIKHQLDCFMMDHIFKGIGDEQQTEFFINNNLNRFMIRGLMTINVNQKPFSRNSYRHEHRMGNVVMSELAEPQYIKDNKMALVLSLMQYKTIKELKQKSNNQFEIGMLAGFESFKNVASEYEEETIDSKTDKRAKDEDVIRSIVESYEKEFSVYPPHPKQDSLVDELFKLMLEQQKSLVFVRRIASVRELERKLLKKYSDHLLSIIKGIPRYEKYTPLKKLIEKSELEKDRNDIERILDLIATRILPGVKADFYFYFNNDLTPEQEIAADLRELFNAISETEEVEKFQKEVANHVERKNISTSLKEISAELLKRKWAKTLIVDEDEEEMSIDEDDFTEEKSPYFFQRFFYNEGRKFKKRIYTKDWFELNLILINERYNLFRLNKRILSEEPGTSKEKGDLRKFTILRERTILALRSTEKIDATIRDEFSANTFLTELLLELEKDAFGKWIEVHRIPYNSDSYSDFINEIDTLNEILRSIFRQGSGFIPVFIAEALTAKMQNPKEEFTEAMKRLLTGDFRFVLNEIETILLDYDKIVEKNFDNRYKIRYNLIQQLPVLGVSGQHKRDVRKTAIQFRMPGYPYVLIATDILKEGEDLHAYCKNIYHYGIAWNPSDMEQRTGRIDRIDSLTYKRIKKIDHTKLSEIPFDSKLQVFYPYLADTLEVNQMCNLFSGMDKFIDIFYNDLSVRIEKKSTANIDDLVENIIPQRKGLLESKYDVNSFIKFQNCESDHLVLREFEGTDLIELQSRIIPIFDWLKQKSSYQTLELDIRSLKIIGILKIRNNRQGPFLISIDQKKQIGQFQYMMESCLGRIHVFGSHLLKQKLNAILDAIATKYNMKIEPIEKNSLIWLQTTSELNEDLSQTYHKLISFVHLTDRLESSLTKKDENIENKV